MGTAGAAGGVWTCDAGEVWSCGGGGDWACGNDGGLGHAVAAACRGMNYEDGGGGSGVAVRFILFSTNVSA
jgi:hypothetical protein